MQWSDLREAPPRRRLRQFAGLWLGIFGGLAAWRTWQGQTGVVTDVVALAAVVVGVTGLVWPKAVRAIYTGWMMAAFPIGWTVSRLMLGLAFYLVFTPVGLVFKLTGRDVLRLRRRSTASYWTAYPSRKPDEYFRQF